MKGSEMPVSRPRPRLDVLTLEPSWLPRVQHIMLEARRGLARKRYRPVPRYTKPIGEADTPPIYENRGLLSLLQLSVSPAMQPDKRVSSLRDLIVS